LECSFDDLHMLKWTNGNTSIYRNLFDACTRSYLPVDMKLSLDDLTKDGNRATSAYKESSMLVLEKCKGQLVGTFYDQLRLKLGVHFQALLVPATFYTLLAFSALIDLWCYHHDFIFSS
jgi:hypothetical protein